MEMWSLEQDVATYDEHVRPRAYSTKLYKFVN